MQSILLQRAVSLTTRLWGFKFRENGNIYKVFEKINLMVRGTFYGEDICVWLSEEEIVNLGLLEIKENKLIYPPLEVRLNTSNDRGLKAVVQNRRANVKEDDFKGYWDGIKVDRTDYGFSVTITDDALRQIRDSDSFGTRYNGYDKINFFTV